MQMTRKEFFDALGGTQPAARELMNEIKKKLAKGERVTIEEPRVSLSLLESNGPGKYKTTPIADE